MSTLQDILDQWQNNLYFRESFKKNPEKALKDAGLTVSAEDLDKIKSMLAVDTSNNEKLEDRINK
jgi:hypothetical protein